MVQTLRMNPKTDPSIPAETQPPALDLERLAALTRAYASLSHDHGGWAGICGGACLMGVAAVEAWGRGGDPTAWKFWIGGFAPLPLRTGLILLSVPILWILLRAFLLRHIQDRYGAVAPRIEPDEPREKQLRVKNAIARVMLPLIMVGGVWMLARRPLAGMEVRIVAILALALGLCVFLPRWKGRTERMVGILLFIAPVCVLAGFQMGAGDTMLAFPVIGLISIGVGVRDHRLFRETLRDLRELA